MQVAQCSVESENMPPRPCHIQSHCDRSGSCYPRQRLLLAERVCPANGVPNKLETSKPRRVDHLSEVLALHTMQATFINKFKAYGIQEHRPVSLRGVAMM